jgi:hypothetical protein
MIKQKIKDYTTGKIKKRLDTIFSKYIRAKYPKICYTCKKPTDKLQCGHFVSRQYLVTRWDENNCRPQCWGCNGYGRGQLLDFEENLISEIGKEKVEALKASRHQVLKLDRGWYEAQIDKYTTLLETLGKSNTLI